jgi:hypothetical protein
LGELCGEQTFNRVVLENQALQGNKRTQRGRKSASQVVVVQPELDFEIGQTTDLARNAARELVVVQKEGVAQ